MTVHYEPVHKSSNISALGYRDGTAYVQFHGGRRFAYKIPLGLFNEMKTAPSVGGFFSKHVKGTTPVVWNGNACSNSPCTEDATHKGDVAGNSFHVCATCSKAARFAHANIQPIEAKK